MTFSLSSTFSVFDIFSLAGRRILLIFSLVVLALAMFMFSSYFVIAKYQIIPGLAIAAAFTFFLVFSLGIGTVPWLILAELFPTSIRGQAASLATCVNWTGSFIVLEMDFSVDVFSFLQQNNHYFFVCL